MIRPLLLAIIHLKNINNIKRDDLNMLFRKLWESFCTFIGVVSGVVSIILVFATDKNLEHTIALIVLSVTSLASVVHTAQKPILFSKIFYIPGNSSLGAIFVIVFFQPVTYLCR